MLGSIAYQVFYTCFPHAFPCYSTIRNVPMLAWEAFLETPCFPWSFDLMWNPWFSCLFFQHEFFMNFTCFFYLGRDGKSIVPGEGGLNVLHKIEPNTKSVYILLFFIVFCWWVENIKAVAMIVFWQFGDYGVNERSLSCILKNINLAESKQKLNLCNEHIVWRYNNEKLFLGYCWALTIESSTLPLSRFFVK